MLAIALRTGRLLRRLRSSRSTVGPALGADSIKKGVLASAIGGLGIIVFMIVYYSFSV